jgi:hypothetical protein
MPWHEPRLTGASGEPTVREGQGKLTRAENFYQRGATPPPTQTIQIAANLVAESFDQPLKMKNLRMA